MPATDDLSSKYGWAGALILNAVNKEFIVIKVKLRKRDKTEVRTFSAFFKNLVRCRFYKITTFVWILG